MADELNPEENYQGEKTEIIEDNYIMMNGARPFLADQSMGNNLITDLKAPVNDNDAARKKYVDDNTASVDAIAKDFTAGENIDDGDAVFVAGGTEVITSGQSADGSTDQDFGNATTANTDKLAQSFESSEAITIEKIKVKLANVNSPTDNVRVSIQGDNSGVPDGTEIEGVTIASGSMTTSIVEYTLTLEGLVSITASTKYWIVIERSGSGDNTNKYKTSKGGTYASGAGFKIDINGSWTALAPATDLHFDLLIPITAGRVYRTRATDLDFMDTIGVADSTVIIGASVDIIVEGNKTKTAWGLTPYSRYYLSETAGAITTTPPSNVKIIGYSLSATELLMSFTAGGRTDLSNEALVKSFTAGEDIVAGNAVGYISEQIDETTNPTIAKSANVRSLTATTNYSPGLQIHKRTSPAQEIHGLCYWTDLGDVLPSGATILEIKIFFYINSAQNNVNTATVYVNEASFDETAITWNTKPTATTSLANFSIQYTGWKDTGWFAITSANWTKLVNNGITLKTPSYNGSLVIYLDDETDTNPPYIHVKYETGDGKVYKVEATTSARANSYIGLANEAGIKDGAVNVEYGGINDNQSGMTVLETMYLSDTAGAIANSAGSTSKKLGKAITATDLLIINDNV